MFSLFDSSLTTLIAFSHSPISAPSLPLNSLTLPACLLGTVSRCVSANGVLSQNATNSSDSSTILKEEGSEEGGMSQKGQEASGFTGRDGRSLVVSVGGEGEDGLKREERQDHMIGCDAGDIPHNSQ